MGNIAYKKLIKLGKEVIISVPSINNFSYSSNCNSFYIYAEFGKPLYIFRSLDFKLIYYI